MLRDRFKVAENKITLIPNFTDTSELNRKRTPRGVRRNEKPSHKIYNILAVGRFHKEKNFEILLQALKNVSDKNIKITLIGEGPKEQDYRKYITRHKINAELIGPQKDLTNYLDNADVCILPSVRDPFPGFMLQAGLFKKPFIGSNVDGISELIITGSNGLLFESGNADDLAQKIIQFINKPSLSKKCAENLHKDVLKKYTEKSVIHAIEKLYKNLMQ